MRRRDYSSAHALRAFLAQDGSDMDWAGALLFGEALDDLRTLRQFAVGYAKAMSKSRPARRKGGMRRR